MSTGMTSGTITLGDRHDVTPPARRAATARDGSFADGHVVAKDREIAFKQATIDKITHEMAVLKRVKFAARSALAHTV